MLKWIMRGLVFALGSWLGVQLVLRVLMRYRPFPIPAEFGPVLASSLRMLYRDPARVVDFAGVRKNAMVIDAGCGKGIFTQELAARVGPGGMVYAVDLQKDMLDATRHRLENHGLKNVQLIQAHINELNLPAESADLVLMISVLPMMADKLRALREIKRVLRPGGTLVLGEEFLEPEYARPSNVRNWAESAGFQLVARSGNGVAYLLKFVKPVRPSDVLNQSQ